MRAVLFISIIIDASRCGHRSVGGGGGMRISVGVDVAKEVHWATAVDAAGEVVLNRRVPNEPAALEALIAGLEALAPRDEVVVGLDVLGGIAGLLQAMLAAAGFRLVHV